MSTDEVQTAPISADKINEDLSNFIMEYLGEDEFERISLRVKQAEEKEASFLITKIVESVVFGPHQDVFSGQEIISAIENAKASAFSGAFLELAEAIVSQAISINSERNAESYKDFRDIFILSVLSASIRGGENISVIRSILKNENILDQRGDTMHNALLNFFYNETKEEASGAVALPMFMHRKLSNDDVAGGEYSWTPPVHIDSMFKY